MRKKGLPLLQCVGIQIKICTLLESIGIPPVEWGAIIIKKYGKLYINIEKYSEQIMKMIDMNEREGFVEDCGVEGHPCK